MIILNSIRVIIILSSIVFSIYASSYYEGSKIIFFCYNLILILLTYNLTNKSSSFFSFFSAFYLFMGFWFKYNFSLVFNNGYVFDSGSMDSSNIDEVLLLSIYIFIIIILSNFVCKNFNYHKYNLEIKNNFISKKYFKFKYLILFFFILSIISVGLVNYYFKIYIKGLIFDNNFSFIFTSLIKWFLLYGLTICSCYIINKELRKNNSKIILFIFLVFFELFASYTSMLSRAIILFGLPFLYSIIFYNYNSSNFIKKYFITITIYLLFSIASIYISNHLRLQNTNFLKEEVRILYENSKKSNSEINSNTQNFENSKRFNFQINEDLLTENSSGEITGNKITYFIIINRWVGIDSLINVSNSNNLGFEILIKAFKEKKSNSGNSFYETTFSLENKKHSFSSNNVYVKGNTLPGLFTFLYYSGSLVFLLISIFILNVFFIFLEKKIFLISNKNLIFVAFFSHCIVNRMFSFGYAPRDSYLFIISLLLSVILIYFLETTRFDKIFSNLK